MLKLVLKFTCECSSTGTRVGPLIVDQYFSSKNRQAVVGRGSFSFLQASDCLYTFSLSRALTVSTLGLLDYRV